MNGVTQRKWRSLVVLHFSPSSLILKSLTTQHIFCLHATAPPLSTHRQSTALPRSVSLKSTADSGGSLHVPPSLFPPNTPHPTPVTTEQDRRYVHAEGVTLVSRMWGEEQFNPTKAGRANNDWDRDTFALLWDEVASVWVAVYRMCINIGVLLC